jgi:serine/threonine protein kinase
VNRGVGRVILEGVNEGNPLATLPRPGDTIAGKYVIVKVIGEGGMGVVYEANHLRLRRRVALKMLLPHIMTTSSDMVVRFEREARAAGKLRDRHVTKVLDVDATEEGLPYLVMEYLEGHDLEAELATRGRLPIDEAVGYLLQVCAAMTEAHNAGIVHRDLKPSNLFLCPDRDGWLVKVLDFGISKMADEGESRLTGTLTSVGTPLYMSPEQVRSARDVDSRTDIWALGVILYELLAGRTPFEGSTTAAAAAIVADPTPPLDSFREDVPPGLLDAIHRALSKDRGARQATAVEFAQSIAPFAGAIHPSVAPPSIPLSGSAASTTPAPSSAGPVTPAPPLYRRAPEGTETLPGEDLAHAASSSPAIAPPVQSPRPSKRWVLAGAAAGTLLAAAAVLHSGDRGISKHTVTSEPTADSKDSAPPLASSEPPQPPLQAASGTAAEMPPASGAPSLSPSRPAPKPGPAPRAAVRPPPAPAGVSPQATPPPTPQPAHGPANPLFL